MISRISSEPLVAVGPGTQHKVLTETHLDKCLRRNHNYLCDFPLVTHSNYQRSCVGALMGQHAEAIEQLCNIHTEHEVEIVLPASDVTFAVYSPKAQTAHGNCINGTSFTKHLAFTSIVEVAPGCRLTLRDHVIDVPFSIVAPKIPLIHQTTWDTLEVPKNLLRQVDLRQAKLYTLLANDSIIDKGFQDDLRMSNMQLSALHRTLTEEVQRQQTSFVQYFSSISAALVGFAIIILVCFCCQYWCRRRSLASALPTFRHADLPEGPVPEDNLPMAHRAVAF